MKNALRLQVIMDLANRVSAPLAAISKSSAHAAQTLKATRDTLKKLNEQQRAVDGFTKQQAAMAEARNSVRVLQQNLDVLRTTQGANSKQALAAEKALTKQTAAFEKQRDAALRLRSKLNELGISNVADGQARLRTEITQTNRAIEQQTAKIKALGKLSQAGVGQAVGKVTQRLGGLTQHALIGGAGIGYFLKRNLVDVASEFERFQTILETTEGSSAGAQNAMKWVSDFAAKTPYELAQVNEAFVKLRAYGLDPKNGLLKTLGDTSAAMGKPVMQAVEAIADAITGENERLKEFGIKGSKSKGIITYEYTDKAGQQQTKTVQASNRKLIESTLSAIWNEKYAGAMDKLSGTWAGMISNVSDQWARFANNTMNAGLFEWMKNKLGGVLATLDKMASNGELQAWATKTGNTLKSFAVHAWELGSSIANIMQRLASFVGGWENLGMILVAVKFLPLVLSIGSLLSTLGTASGALLMFATGTTAIGPALLAVGMKVKTFGMLVGSGMATAGRAMWAFAANPVVLAIVAAVALIAGAAYLIYKNWGPITAFFRNLWASIKAVLGGLWESFKQLGGMLMDGLVSGITSKVTAVKDAIGSAASGAIGWFKEKLGIKSPSRVFMAAGVNIGEGAALGIQRSITAVKGATVGLTAATMMPLGAAAQPPALATLPPAARVAAATVMREGTYASIQRSQAIAQVTAGGMAAISRAAPLPVPQQGSGSARGQGDTHITVHVHAAPGMDAQGVARAVALELERQRRMEQARQRSRLGDIA